MNFVPSLASSMINSFKNKSPNTWNAGFSPPNIGNSSQFRGGQYGTGNDSVTASARNYGQEMLSGLQGQAGIMDPTLQLENFYTPQFLSSQSTSLGNALGGANANYQQAIRHSGRLAGQTLQQMTPAYGAASMIGQQMYRQSMGSAAGLLDTMQSQAANELSLGRSLSAEEQRMGEQSARFAMGARGLQGGNQAIAAEVLNNYNLGTNRESQRRNYAQNVYGMSEASAGNAYNQYSRPLMELMGQTSAGNLMQESWQRYGNMGPKLFNPESGYNASLISGNQRAAVDLQMAKLSADAAAKQASATSSAGKSSMFGTIIGAGISLF